MEHPFIGEIAQYAFNYAPPGWAPCAGQVMPLYQGIPLFEVIHNKFGGDGMSTFALPDYSHLSSQGLQFCIALTGAAPSAGGPSRPQSLGEIANLPYGFAPTSWVECNGQMLQVAEHQALYHAIATTFGGDGETTFGAPNLIHFPPTPLASDTDSQYYIAVEGDASPVNPFVGKVQLLPFHSAPNGWMTCSGQLLPINQNQELFSVIGVNFGGDGRTKFALPDLRHGQIPLPGGMEYCIAVTGTFPARNTTH